jgi:hypothetical protein
MITRLLSTRASAQPQQADSPAAENGNNRRTWDRFPCDLVTHCHPIGFPESLRLQVRVCNISRAGANLLLDRSFASGTILRLELPDPLASGGEGSGASAQPTPGTVQPPSARMTVLACVVQAVAQPSGGWQLGCTFVNELRDDDLTPFGARVERPRGPDQRRWVRFACDFEARYRLIRGTEGEPQSARVLDISASGIGLAAAHPVDGGTLVSLELPSTGGRPFKILACVVRTRQQQDGSWLLGCNFIRELQENELQQLLRRDPVGAAAQQK